MPFTTYTSSSSYDMAPSTRQRPSSSHIKSEQPTNVDNMPSSQRRFAPATAPVSNETDSVMTDGSVNHAGPSTQQDPLVSSFETMETLGEKAKALVDAVHVLEHAGVEATGLPLPKIVTVGDQSAGKSSLIEAISAIRVPRATNTCTRCPLQISLTQAPSPSWKVTIHNKYFYSPPHPYSEPMTNDGLDIGPWKLMDSPEDGPSVSTQSEHEVQRLIELAQLAILCPGSSAEQILKGGVPASAQCEFSPNVVKLEVTGPTLPTLMMYDLPGIISQSHTNDDTLPTLIQRLAEEYIKNANTIVVLACPIGSDHVNSRAAKVVKDCKAEPRTVGVITKPDKLDMADHRQWAEMLVGDKFKLGHGYYVTKQLGADETFQSHQRTREKEAKFFQTDKRWTDRNLKMFSNRFGTPKLQTKLSELLANEISHGLPIINREVQERIAYIGNQLRYYPKPKENAYSSIHDAIKDIELAIWHSMRGDDGHKQFIQEWKNIADAYDQTLKDMKPGLVVSTGPEEQWQLASSNPIQIDSDDDDDEPTPETPLGQRKRPMPPPNTPSKRHQRSTPSSSTPRHGKQHIPQPQLERTLYMYPPIADKTSEEHAPKWNLDYIKEMVRREATSGIPRDTDPAAEDALIKTALSKWNLALEDTMDSVKMSLKRHVLGLLKSQIKEWESTDFYRKTLTAVDELLETICDSAQKSAMLLVDAQNHKPFTRNIDGLESAKARELVSIRNSRQFNRKKAYLVWKAGNRRLEPQEIDQKLKTVKDSELGEDPYAREVHIVVAVRGYYNLAACTMVDTLGHIIQFSVFHKMARGISGHIKSCLQLDGPNFVENANALLAEDPTREQMRAKLEAEQVRLTEAQRHLRTLGV